jgi:transposase InsO family protein
MEIQHDLIVQEVLEIRGHHPRIGGRKLLCKLENFFKDHHIKMGRDALFNLLSEYNLLIRRRKRNICTTQSKHWMKKHPNLIKDFTPQEPNNLYVSDITYWKTDFGVTYISLITDAYSRKIVGYNLADNMEAIESVKALEMALKSNKKSQRLIHHSDRGSQYCSAKYVDLLKKYEVEISMTESGDPLDNAIAERINGILKGEYLECYSVASFDEAKALLDSVVKLYNEDRPHMSIGNHTPEEVHNQVVKDPERLWKSYYKTPAIVA